MSYQVSLSYIPPSKSYYNSFLDDPFARKKKVVPLIAFFIIRSPLKQRWNIPFTLWDKVGAVQVPNELSSNSNYRAINWKPAMFVSPWATVKGRHHHLQISLKAKKKWCDLRPFRPCNNSRRDVEAIQPLPAINCCWREPLRPPRPLRPHLWPPRGFPAHRLPSKWPLKSLWSKGPNPTRNKKLHSVYLSKTIQIERSILSIKILVLLIATG